MSIRPTEPGITIEEARRRTQSEDTVIEIDENGRAHCGRPEEERVAADQAACRHRFKLVGYRDRMKAQETGGGFIIMDAVLVCVRCTAEHLTGVTRIPPAPIIQTGRR